MRRPSLLLVLLGLNVILAAGWIITGLRAGRSTKLSAAPPAATHIRTNVLVRKQFFSWQELESSDYPTYVANLRDIGCPEQTIRDIIVADVRQLYSQKLGQLVSAYNQHGRTNENNQAQADALRRARLDLETERRALLTQLLGTNWETMASTGKRPAFRLPLEGPVLGALSPETKQAVRDLVDQAEAQAKALGLGAANAAGVVRFEKELWTKLAGVLSPQQLEEFKLRYSANAGELRRELDALRYFRATPNELRNLFRATDEIDNQLRMLGNGTDTATQEKRQSLQQQREDAIRNNLGADRYAEYAKLQDPAYQDAMTKARAAGGSAQMVQTLYRINQATADQEALIQANPSLTDAQREIELKKVQLDQLKAQAQAMGQELPPEPAPPPAPPAKSYSNIPHVIGSKETLTTLTRLYGVSAQALQDANPGVNLNSIKPGDTVNVPHLPPGTPAQ